jgi:ATP-binding protein involved in chromosome partitioning
MNRQGTHGSGGSGHGPGDTRPDREELERQQDARLGSHLKRIRHKILILSGKGGVGKSSVAAGLAIELARRGRRTGLLDIDLHGPSIPRLLGLTGARVTGNEHAIDPVEANPNLMVMSLGFLLPQVDAPVIWRGPLKYNMIKQFLSDVDWGDLDFLIVDSPPSTGDEPLAIGQLVKDADGAIVVTTPQILATDDVRRSINFARQLSLPVIGVIENMSGLICPECGARIDIFGSHGGEEMSREMGVPVLGNIPVDPGIVRSGDSGALDAYLRSDAPGAEAFASVVEKILQAVDAASINTGLGNTEEGSTPDER